MLSERRDKHAARRFRRGLVEVAERRPRRVTTDLHPAYRRAIRWIIGRKALHRTTQYLNNYTEQQLHRAERSSREATLLPDAGLREFRVGVAILRHVRSAATCFRVRRRRDAHVSLARAATTLPHALPLADRGHGRGAGRSRRVVLRFYDGLKSDSAARVFATRFTPGRSPFPASVPVVVFRPRSEETRACKLVARPLSSARHLLPKQAASANVRRVAAPSRRGPRCEQQPSSGKTEGPSSRPLRPR